MILSAGPAKSGGTTIASQIARTSQRRCLHSSFTISGREEATICSAESPARGWRVA